MKAFRLKCTYNLHIYDTSNDEINISRGYFAYDTSNDEINISRAYFAWTKFDEIDGAAGTSVRRRSCWKSLPRKAQKSRQSCLLKVDNLINSIPSEHQVSVCVRMITYKLFNVIHFTVNLNNDEIEYIHTFMINYSMFFILPPEHQYKYVRVW